MTLSNTINNFLDQELKFLSPNEPITPYGIDRVVETLRTALNAISYAADQAFNGARTITLWDQNMTYQKGDIVLYFKKENHQVFPEVGVREFVFILISTSDSNTSIPNYDLVDGIPVFTKSNWSLLNPMSYLLQDMIELKKVVKSVFSDLLAKHVSEEHGMAGGGVYDIEKTLLKKDYSNLMTPDRPGKFSLDILNSDGIKMSSNGVMECSIQYSLDAKSNPQDLKILDERYYYQKSPIWDESDHSIFSQKYMEEASDMFSVVLKNGVEFNNLRYGTNIFHARIVLPVKFVDSEYCVFFDTYERGQFVFGLGKNDLMAKTEPTYDSIVSQPMLLNKSPDGFDIVIPIHTHFNSIQKYRVGVPWMNKFRLHAIGKYR